MKQTISWLAFCVSNSVTRTLVHFFPVTKAGGAAAYCAEVSLTLFTEGQAPATLTLEGARLSQPDGVRLDELFPDLSEHGGLYGLRVDMQCSQVRLDHASSQCIVEFVSKGHSVRYSAVMVDEQGRAVRESGGPGLALQDSYNSTSLVVVNPTEVKRYPQVKCIQQASVAPAVTSTRLTTPQREDEDCLASLLPRDVKEVRLDKKFYSEGAPQECSWGMTHVNQVDFEESDEHCAYFLLYRDAITKRPMTVCGI